MSQDTGLFSVRRPREVNIHICTTDAILTACFADIGRHQLQLRHSSTCLCSQALKLHLQHQRKQCTSYITPCSLSLLFSYVARSQPTSTAQFPTTLFREQHQCAHRCANEPPIYNTAKLFFQSLWWSVSKPNELCTRRNDASEPAIFQRFSKLAAKK